jgi:hypothetical protein
MTTVQGLRLMPLWLAALLVTMALPSAAVAS